MMTAEAVRRVRVAEREALLGRVVAALRADARVVGAWAFGSIGRGTADEWSDVDLRVVVRDDAVEEVVAGRHEMVNGVGEALLEQDVPQNGPPGGAFRLCAYVGEGGLQEIDWTWAPYSGSTPPEDVRVLFGQAELGRAPEARGWPKAKDERDPVVARATFFWAMALVAAKYIARGDSGHTAQMLRMLVEGQRFVRERIGASMGEAIPAADEVAPREGMGLLGEQCRGMEELWPVLGLERVSPAGRVDARYVKGLYAMLNLVESLGAARG